MAITFTFEPEWLPFLYILGIAFGAYLWVKPPKKSLFELGVGLLLGWMLFVFIHEMLHAGVLTAVTGGRCDAEVFVTWASGYVDSPCFRDGSITTTEYLLTAFAPLAFLFLPLVVLLLFSKRAAVYRARIKAHSMSLAFVLVIFLINAIYIFTALGAGAETLSSGWPPP
jgi:hypothetical protein